MKKSSQASTTKKKRTIELPEEGTTKAFVKALTEIRKQKQALQRALKVLDETETEIKTKTNLFTLYDIQRTIREEIKRQVIESNDDFLKSVFADVVDGKDETAV